MNTINYIFITHMEGVTMKKMLTGLFFLLLAIWTQNFSSYSNASSLYLISIVEMLIGFVYFLLGYVDDFRK